MRQYRTVAQILLILSIFNLVFAIPVVREFDDANGNVVAPAAVRNVAATSKERREVSEGTPSSSSPPLPNGPPPDGSTSHSSPPLPDGSPSDGPAPSHESLPPPPGGPAALEAPPHAGGPAALDALPPAGEPAALDAPPPAGGLPAVPAPDQPAPGRPTSKSQIMPITDDAVHPPGPPGRPPMSTAKGIGALAGAFTVDAVLAAAIIGGVVWHNHHKHHSRTIDPGSPTAKRSRHPGFERDD